MPWLLPVMMATVFISAKLAAATIEMEERKAEISFFQHFRHFNHRQPDHARSRECWRGVRSQRSEDSRKAVCEIAAYLKGGELGRVLNSLTFSNPIPLSFGRRSAGDPFSPRWHPGPTRSPVWPQSH